MLIVKPLTRRAGFRIEGEADALNERQLRDALAALPPGPPVVHLELAGLTFVDITGARALMSVARRHPPPRLILHEPPPALMRVIDLLWPGGDVEVRVRDPGGDGP